MNEPIAKERNKKMIGSLLNHLGKAKQKLDDDAEIVIFIF